MEDTTVDQKALFLSNVRSTWLEEILVLCIIVPMGIIGTILNLLSLSIFLRKTIRDKAFFKYLIVHSAVNSIIAFSSIFFFYHCGHIFYDLVLSISGRIFNAFIMNSIIGYFYSFSTFIEIMINIERALFFCEGFQNYKKISPYLISVFIFILSLIIYTPNFLSLKMVPTDQLYIVLHTTETSEFGLSKIGKILLIVSFILEGPIVILLLLVTYIIAVVSYEKFVKKKESLQRTNTIEMLPERELKKKIKSEKKYRNMLIMTSYLSIFSIVSSIVHITTLLLFYIVTTLSPQTLGWLVFGSFFSISFKQLSSIIIYYNNKIFKKEFNSIIFKIINIFKLNNWIK
jgi:hypothetical protein